MKRELRIAFALPFLVFGAIQLSTLPANARPSTKSYTCEGVRNFISNRGAVVMDAKNSRVFRRFVKNRSFCPIDQVLFRYVAPTKSGSCQLYICRAPETDIHGLIVPRQ